MKFGAGENGLTTVEFSIQGMRQADDQILITEVAGVTNPPPNIFLGDIHGPVDTTQTANCTTAAPCGISIAWPQCIPGPGNVALLRISFITFANLSNKVFTVLRRYPPVNPLYPFILFNRCDEFFTKVITPGGCYVSGWDGTTNPVNGCQIRSPAVDEATWSGMKQLFR
jgi:hypothetical protein